MIAEYDELTGLATKDFFYENVEAAIKMNNSEQHNLLYLNIDNFKIFNDFHAIFIFSRFSFRMFYEKIK